MLFALPLAAVLLGAAAPARADETPPMWGVGAAGGTIVIPGFFPAKLPHEEDGLTRVKGDGFAGLHGVLYVNDKNRLGTHLSYGFASGFGGMAWTAEFERILVGGGGVDAFAGGGIGFGSYKFTADDESVLAVPTYEARAQAGAVLKQSHTAEEVSLFLKQPFNGNPTWTPKGGAQADSNGGNLFHIGLEFTVYGGDFRMR